MPSVRWCGDIYEHDAHLWTDPFRRLEYECDGQGLPKNLTQVLATHDDDPSVMWADHGDYITECADIADWDRGNRASEAERIWRDMGDDR